MYNFVTFKMACRTIIFMANIFKKTKQMATLISPTFVTKIHQYTYSSQTHTRARVWQMYDNRFIPKVEYNIRPMVYDMSYFSPIRPKLLHDSVRLSCCRCQNLMLPYYLLLLIMIKLSQANKNLKVFSFNCMVRFRVTCVVLAKGKKYLSFYFGPM